MTTTTLFRAAHAAAKAFHCDGDSYRTTFRQAYRDLQIPGTAERIVAEIRRKANPLLLSARPRFAMLRHYAGLVEAYGAERTA